MKQLGTIIYHKFKLHFIFLVNVTFALIHRTSMPLQAGLGHLPSMLFEGIVHFIVASQAFLKTVASLQMGF